MALLITFNDSADNLVVCTFLHPNVMTQSEELKKKKNERAYKPPLDITGSISQL